MSFYNDLELFEPSSIRSLSLGGFSDDLMTLDADGIAKALAYDPDAGTNASSMVGESLDAVVKRMVVDPKIGTVLLQRNHAYKAKSLREEWNKLFSYGTAETSSRAEGQLGLADSSRYVRATMRLKSFGQVGRITMEVEAASAAKFMGLKVREANNRLAKLLIDIEKSALWGNEELNPLYMQGVFRQASTDAEFNRNLVATGIAGTRETYTGGGTLTSALVRGVSETPLINNGTYSALYCAPADKSAISSSEDTNIRYYHADVKSSITKGMKVDKLNTDFGEIDILWSLYLRFEGGRERITPNNPADPNKFHSQVPAQLAVASFSVAAAAGGKLPVDEYFYGIAPVNEAGEAPIRLLASGATTTNDNGIVEITITHPADTSKIKGYRVYRSTTNGSDYTKMRFLKEVAIDTDAATQVIEDDGTVIPGARKAFLVAEESMSFAFLKSPHMRELARIDNTDRFTVDAVAGLNLYIPEHAFVFHNIGGSVADPVA